VSNNPDPHPLESQFPDAYTAAQYLRRRAFHVRQLVEALQAMLDHYGPPKTIENLCTYPADHPITKAKAALAGAEGD
jgi:hypothetical protein